MRKLTYEEILSERISDTDFILKAKAPINVILHNVRSMYNVGSFFRTCDSASINELILTGYTPYPPRKEIDKTALGATKTVKWSYESDIIAAINLQKQKGYKVFAVELTDRKRLYNSLAIDDYPLCLVFGNELIGIDDDVIAECYDSLEIPMYGTKHSLNVAVAGGIVIYEALHCWKSFEG